MKLVLKYQLSPVVKAIELPANLKILTVQVQKGIPTLWAEVDDAAALITYPLFFVLTGGAVPEAATDYIGTSLLNGDSFVVHFYLGKALAGG